MLGPFWTRPARVVLGNGLLGIGDQLRAMYDELMQQPVPDRFKELLDQLDKKNEGKEGSE